MADYSGYFDAIAGKSFPTSYVFQARQYYPYDVSTSVGEDYQGYVSDFAPGPFATDVNSFTIAPVDPESGLFNFIIDGKVSGEWHLAGATDDGNSLIFATIPDHYSVFPFYGTYVLTSDGVEPSGSVGFSSSNSYHPQSSACFASGTMIRTARGEVAVENLRVGQRVRCEDGSLRPILWIGMKVAQCTGNPWGGDQLPILIERHAFAHNIPYRDLYVSQWHSFEVEPGKLLQVA